MLQTLAGIILLILGVVDGAKYIVQANKVIQNRTSKGISRFFIDLAWLVDLGKIICGIVVMEKWLVITNVIGFICVGYLFLAVYNFYPYKRRGLNGFKKPNIILYTINSLLPNSIRKRL